MRTSERFRIVVMYSQIAVFDPSMDSPFNDWAEPHVAQGFAWRPTSVSFGTLFEGGGVEVELRRSEDLQVKPETVRAIRVPFTVTRSGKVQVTSVTGDGPVLDVGPGQNDLLFETGLLPSKEMWCRFTLTPSSGRSAAILRQDTELHPRWPLLMEAKPA